MRKLKKILISLALISFLIGVMNAVKPSLAFAELKVGGEEVTGPPQPQCCKMKHNIEGWGGKYGPGTGFSPWVGAPEGSLPSGVTKAEACPGKSDYTEDPNWAGFCVLDGVASIGDWVKYISMIAVGAALLFAAIMFITAAGSPERVNKAKAIFFYSLIGVLIATLAHFLPAFVRYFIGV